MGNIRAKPGLRYPKLSIFSASIEIILSFLSSSTLIKIKSKVLKKSIVAIVKSGTVSLDVCKNNIPSMIIYKMNFFNYHLAKFLLKIKYVNMINIINNKEIIPELLQNECNPNEIYKTFYYFMKIGRASFRERV